LREYEGLLSNLTAAMVDGKPTHRKERDVWGTRETLSGQPARCRRYDYPDCAAIERW
jgi:hypothetical protein